MAREAEKRLTVALDGETYRRLRIFAAQTGQKHQEIIEGLIKSHIGTSEPKRPVSESAYPSAAEREDVRVSGRAAFVAAGYLVTDSRPGLIILDGQYEASLIGRKWRRIGKAKWYWYSTAAQLAEKIPPAALMAAQEARG